MVGWIEKMKKIDGWWMDGYKNRWMVGWMIKKYGWLDG